MKRYLILSAILYLLLFSSEARSASREQLVGRIKNAEKILDEMIKSPDISIPLTLLQKCYAVVILRQYRGGFFIGGKGGNGIIIARDRETGKWSPPAFVATVEVNIGFQIGAQSIDAILFFMNKESLDMLLKSKIKLGVDVSVSAGPYGREAGAKVGPGAGILVYSRTKGLYAGALFEGGVLVSDDKANEEFYRIKGIKIRDILIRGRVKIPKEAKTLIDKLKRWSEIQYDSIEAL